MVTQAEGISELDALILNTYNPFRYRGYFYDVETGLYYLQSRYYNPQWGRFISADHWDVLLASPGALTDKNLFAYCDNNPIMRADQDGEFWHIFQRSRALRTGGSFRSARFRSLPCPPRIE